MPGSARNGSPTSDAEETSLDAIDAIRGRRSIRDYLQELPDRELISEIIRDAAHAPWTPISRPEPWVFTVIEGCERIAGYGERALRFARENKPDRPGYAWVDDPAFSVFYNAPALILISGNVGSPVALEECTRAAQLLTISAHARGLGSCWVGAPNLWLADDGVQGELGIPDGFEPLAAVTLGYPADEPAAAARIDPRINWTRDRAGFAAR